MNLYEAVIRLETVKNRPKISDEEVKAEAERVFGSVREQIVLDLQRDIKKLQGRDGGFVSVSRTIANTVK